jgi:D-psicose/D-tagatose/L-ribulose 3-epimerase
MLLWATHVTEEHFPLFAAIKRAGYDGIELPIFEGTPEHFRKVGQAIRDNGLRATAVTVIPDAEHNCVSADPAVRAAALQHLSWAVDCIAAAGGETLCGPFYQPLGVFTGEPPTKAERANVVRVHKDAAAYAARHNVKLSVEPLNRFECYVLNTVADSADVVRQVSAPNYGLLYDTFHANIEEKDPVGVIAPNMAHINHVHFSGRCQSKFSGCVSLGA